MNNMYDILEKINLLEGKGSKPDFLDLDKDGDRKEAMKKAAQEVDEGSTGDYSAKKARAGKDIGKPGKQFAKIAKSAGERYGSKERGEKVAGAVLAKLRAKESVEEGDDIERPRHPQELDYQQGPEDDEQYRRHHGLDDPDRRRERKLRATDYKTLDRLERQAVKRGKQIDEDDVEEGNDFTKARLDAIRAGKPTFKLNGKTYRVTGDTSDEVTQVGEASVKISPLDDPITRFRKKHAPSVMKDPAGREELAKLDTEYAERKKTGYGRGEDEDDEGDDDGKKKPKPAGEKRGRGRPKGTRRAIGAKGPTGRSKLMTRKEGVEEDYDRDEYDEEGEMAKTDARTIEDAAKELQSILDDQENLPEWVQKKISLAKDYVDRARDYMKANRPGTDGEMSLPEAADGEFTQADWNRIVGLKRMLMRMNPKLEPEDAEQKAAEKLGYDYEDVLSWIESDKNLEEKAVSKAQRRAAGIAHAAKKGDIPKSELRGASKEMAKMPGGELKKFAKTKEKGLPEKKTEEVEETTTAGNVAPGGDAPKGGKKGGMQFGKGIYEATLAESFDKKLDQILSEGISVNSSMDESGKKSITVTATDEDAVKLGQLLSMAGIGSSAGYQDACPTCGQSPCGCSELDEDLANSADNTTTMDTDYMVNQLSGGLNGPKLQSNPNNMGDNPLAMRNLGTKASPNLNLGAVSENNDIIELYKRIV